MSKAPSEKTQLRTLRREKLGLQEVLTQARFETNTYRIRATRAEQELAEWKYRFDQLLKLGVDRASDQSAEPPETQP